MHAYSLLPSVPWLTQHWMLILAVGVVMRIAYEWIGTYRRDRSWSMRTQVGILAAGGVLWAPLFLSAR